MALVPVYPNVSQSIWLLLMVVVVTTLVAFPVGITATAFDKTDLLSHPLFLSVVNLVAFGYGVRIGVMRNGAPWRVVLPLRPFPASMALGMMMTLVGCGILVSEVDNFIQSIVPIPEEMREQFTRLIGGKVHIVFSVLVAMVVAPVTEECLFRGVILRGYLGHLSAKRAIVISSFLFGAFHLNLWQFPGATAVGALFGWWYVNTRSLLPCLLGHAFFNAIPIIVYGVFEGVSGLSSDPAGPIRFQPLWLDALGGLLLLLGVAKTDREFRRKRTISSERWTDVPRRFADQLIEKGRDTYGEVETPLFVSQLDIRTGSPPDVTTSLYSTEKRGGAGPATNNLQFDGGLLRLLYGLSNMSGDPKYASSADAYLGYYLEYLPLPSGYFPWGDHRGYDVFGDEAIEGPGEFKVALPLWDRMYAIYPEAVTRQIIALRRHILDEDRSLAFDRHFPPGADPHCTNASPGAWIVAWTFLYKQSLEPIYLDWARSMADYLWSLRNPDTGLLPARPPDPAYPEDACRPGSQRTDLGPMYWLGVNLLHAQRILADTPDTTFRDQALGYIRALTRRFDIDSQGRFYATFDVRTGKALFGRIEDGWQMTPQAERDEPPSGVIGLQAAFSLAYAYQVTLEPDLLQTFNALTPLFEIDNFGREERPEVSAGMLAQAIGAWTSIYEATRDDRYLDVALRLSHHAETHYVKEGWFVCGPPTIPRYRDTTLNGWETYSNRGGSADLALALLRLAAISGGRDYLIEADPLCYF